MSRVRIKNNFREMKLNQHQQLFQSLKDLVPVNWKVIVSADRGLYADWLYQQIVETDFVLRLNVLIVTSREMVGNGIRLILDNQTELNAIG